MSRNPRFHLRTRAFAWRSLTNILPLMHKDDAASTSTYYNTENGEPTIAVRQDERAGAAQHIAWTSQNIGTSPLLFTPPALTEEQQLIVDRFHNLMYEIQDQQLHRTYFVSWLGYGMFKWPTDLWNYQQILTQTQPDIVIETGTHRGGSALFLATICDLLGKGAVISIDIEDQYQRILPRHPRITYLTGSSTSPDVIAEIEKRIEPSSTVLVILDSDHHYDHVLEELKIYSRFVPAKGYMIVEDTNINGHPAYKDFGAGPSEAVDRFLSSNDDFYIDRSQERFYWTQNPNGFLRRK